MKKVASQISLYKLLNSFPPSYGINFSVQFLSSNLQQVGLSQSILRIPSIVLEHILHSSILLNIDPQRLRADEPRHILAAGRGGQRAVVSVNTEFVEMMDYAGEVKGAGFGECAGRADVVEVGEDGVEEGGGVAEGGEFHQEANDGDLFA